MSKQIFSRRTPCLPFLAMLGMLATASCSHIPMAKQPASGGVTLERADIGRGIDSLKIRITSSTHRFYPDETVFVALSTDNKSQTEATLQTQWVFNSRALDEQTNMLSPGDRRLQFSLQRQEGLAAGDYKFEIRVNGSLVKTLEFTVKNR